LPDQGSPAANRSQNSSVLRSEMARREPDPRRDCQPGDGALGNNTGFLRVERYLLEGSRLDLRPEDDVVESP
jgi:hypothetical protein